MATFPVRARNNNQEDDNLVVMAAQAAPPPPRHYTIRSIPQLLAARQVGHPAVTPTKLSSVVAWNVHRMQNMIVAVGPGTPAAAQMSNNNRQAEEDESSSVYSSSSSLMHENDDDDDDDSNQDMNVEDETSGSRRQRDVDTVMEQVLMEYLQPLHNNDDDDDEDHIISRPSLSTSTTVVPSMRHGGCINTAAWLTSPWRLSRCESSSTTAVECTDVPTQVLTSGDDRTVKFWDVSRAMGMDNPLPGGKYSKCPFADYSNCRGSNDHDRTHTNNHSSLAGSVVPLLSLQTGHRANVFHVTPVDAHPGRVLTCGADGFLRMANVTRPENESSSVVVSPEFGIEGSVDDLLPLGLFSLRSEKCMCFSHHLLNANTGLLCGERGLFQFDLRLSPREQSTRSLLGNDKACKSCAIWSAPSSTDIVDSAYVFAGGASSEVALYDLRMTDGSESRIVQKYRPSGLSRDSEVSVSGLDVSKDKRELLVSYENDQVFSFPVFPNSPGGRPTIDEMEEYSDSYSSDGDGPVLSELAAYGGHLNRFTFLKNAKYAGPQDEYICTGSDSGRAWIYERATGTVAAFLAADQSTCNGVMPHPSLPFFITYGIDSTAKLWRATPPVDRDADDSPLGRAREYHRQQYEKSTLVRNWTYAKATAGSIATLDDDESEAVTIYPDQFPISESPTIGNSILGSILMRRRMFGMRATRMSGICNDFRELPNILQKNLFSCVIASEEGESEPVSSGLADLVRRMSTIRLRFQADQRGLVWNPKDPWVLAPRDFYKGMELAEPSARKTVDVSKRESIVYGNPYDLIPGSPSDWLPYDPEMTKTPLPCGPRFNVEDYDDFYHERYSQLGFVVEETKMHGTRSRERAKQTDKVFESNAGAVNKQEPTPSIYDSERALQLLYDTALMLKEGGNAALESGSTMEAARRYDCAIRYCSVAILAHPNANTDLIQATERKWCPLRKLLVSTRLNLCMVLANFDLRGARDQATLALKELAPFCTQPGKVLGGKKLSTVFKEDEPMSTYQEAKELQAKAYFRHGSVDLKVGDYDEAVDEFEESIKCTKELSKEPDRVLLRRLAEAKREKIRKSKRQKRKFKRMLAKEGLKEEEEDSSQG